jgi:protein SCO1/2
MAVAAWLVWTSLPDDRMSSTSVTLPKNVGIDPKFGEVVPTDLQFRNETGDVVTLAEFFTGKPVILTLVYFQCPMLCNMTMEGLVRSMRAMRASAGSDFTVLTVSFDPREGPELAAAAKQTAIDRYGRQGADDGLRFLSGDEQNIRRLAAAVGFRYTYDEHSGQFAHAAGLFVLTPHGEISRFLSGVEFAPRDLQLALKEASAGQFGSFADQILLLCFHYDPAEGQYGLAILRLVRLAGAVTVVVLGASIVVMSRRTTNSTKTTSTAEPE